METALSLSAHSQQFYVMCRHWDSDLQFFRIETAFLHRSLDDYFVRLLNPEYFEDLKRTSQKLFALEKEVNSLRQRVMTHMQQVELAAESIVPEDAEKLPEEQVTIELLLHKLINYYRQVKKEMFALVEEAMHSKKLITK